MFLTVVHHLGIKPQRSRNGLSRGVHQRKMLSNPGLVCLLSELTSSISEIPHQICSEICRLGFKTYNMWYLLSHWRRSPHGHLPTPKQIPHQLSWLPFSKTILPVLCWQSQSLSDFHLPPSSLLLAGSYPFLSVLTPFLPEEWVNPFGLRILITDAWIWAEW